MDYGRPSRAAPSRGGPSQSSAASGIFFHGDGQSHVPLNSMSGAARSCLGPGSVSGPSVGASSLVTDANSALSGTPQLQRSASINNESYMRLPASPLSFSSNSVMDGCGGSSMVQQSPHNEYMHKQGVAAGTSSATSQLTGQEQGASKRPRHDEIIQQQMIQQLLQRGEGHQNPQLQAMIHQQRLAQQRQQQQAYPQMQRAQVQHQQMQRVQMQPQYAQPAAGGKRLVDSGICSRRLMQYMFHQRHGRPENSIVYWRKFVAEYFAPKAKKRWCLSLYENVANHAFGAFPQTSVDAWQCDICGSKSGKGFEATFEVLPRLFQIKFDRGVIDELLFLDTPHECRLPNGIMVLEYAKAVQESVYEQVRVVREGQLRIIFTPQLKILSWEFCARKHDDYLSRRLVAPQLSQLLQIAQRYQTAVTESGPAGLSHQDLQNTCNMFMSASRQLLRNLESNSLNDLGFSKRYVRCLQVAEVVNNMTDLIDYSQEHKTGPIESLKNYAQQAAAKLQNQKSQEQLANANLPTDQSTLNKIMASHAGLNSHMNNIRAGARALNNTSQGAAPWNNYPNFQRGSMSPKHTPLHPPDASNQAGSSQFQGSPSSILTSSQFQGSPSSILTSLQFQGSPSILTNSMPPGPTPQPSGSTPQPNNITQQFQQQAMQQMLHEAMTSNGGASEQSLSMNASLTTRMNTELPRNTLGRPNITANNTMTRSNSQKSISNNPTMSGSSLDAKLDMPQNVQMPELDHDIAGLTESELYDGNLDDLEFDDWK